MRRVFFRVLAFLGAGFFFAEEVLVACANDRSVDTKLHSASASSDNPTIRGNDLTTTDIYRRKFAPMIEASSSARLRTSSWLK